LSTDTKRNYLLLHVFVILKYVVNIFLVSAILYHISLLRLLPKSYFKISTFQPNFLCSSSFKVLINLANLVMWTDFGECHRCRKNTQPIRLQYVSFIYFLIQSSPNYFNTCMSVCYNVNVFTFVFDGVFNEHLMSLCVQWEATLTTRSVRTFRRQVP